MNDACSRLVGSHDFRNFCRIDKNKARLETSYVREIRNAVVEPVSDGPSTSAYDLLRVSVRGSGFLWHQIRCLVTLICEVGAGREEPSLITELLDVKVNAARPQYGMAKDVPLCLFDCSYDGADLDWSFDAVALRQVITTLQKTWADLRIKSELVRSMISVTETFFPDGESTATTALEEFVLDRPTPKKHVPIMKRPLCDSLEAKIEKVAKKARLTENGK
ncbi:pseudouridylate synthase [Aphelenchoides avenae]|nr:pseudouridylate synthase [Aphelenchus avenae]